MTDEMALALERARDADYWWLDVEFGSDISLLDEGRFTLAARHFNTLVYFLPPDDESASWRVGSQDVGDDDDVVELGDLTVAQVIDIVPYAAEDWVLAVTREASEYRLEAEDEYPAPGRRPAARRMGARRGTQRPLEAQEQGPLRQHIPLRVP
jgi:hypothetical protein